MSDGAAPPGGKDLLSPYATKNVAFLATLSLLVFVPGLLTYFGPSIVKGWADYEWLLAAWIIALILIVIADENFVPGKQNFSSGFRHAGHISHSLITNPMFITGLALLVLAPPPITFYGPVVILNSPDWLWLVMGWVVAAAAAFLMFTAIKSEESKLS